MRRFSALAAVTVLAGALAQAGPAMAVPHSKATGLSHRAVCARPAAGQAGCDAQVVTNSKGAVFNAHPSATVAVAGYHPADLQSAYNLPSGDGAGQTVAIVDAYNDPNAASDVGTYRSNFGLPALSTCSVSSGTVVSPGGPCFVKVGQTGSTTSLPTSNTSWSQEISLDVDMVSAICPTCNIELVEASSSSYSNLGAAVDEAAKLGATEISNSYGGSDSSSEVSYNSDYSHIGVAITASSGDGNYGVEFPAAAPSVTAVGGTSLSRASNARGWTESVWSNSSGGAGSGCSAYEAQPAWQSSNTTITRVCRNRAVADVSADADPNTGVSVYDSYASRFGGSRGGWMVFGGTSVASPIIASVYALAGNASTTQATPGAGSIYKSSPSNLNDVTSGSNGSCGGSALCTAGPGWDGPTGLGTPNGIGAF